MVWPFIWGVIFSLGLGISEMTRPPKILGFLNFFGDWDPSLLIVFAVATLTYLLGYKFFIGKSIKEPLEDYLRGKEKIEFPVFAGSAIFGIGWGLLGLCPGPAVVNLVSGHLMIFLFVIGMLVGMQVAKKIV